MIFLKFKTTGREYRNYGIAFFIAQLIALAVYIWDCLIPFGKEFLLRLQTSLNTQKWDLMNLLTPVGKLILYYLIVEGILAIFVFVVLVPLVKRR